MNETENNKKLEALYDKAAANPGILQPLGDLVVCDICNKDWTSSPQTGGFIFESKGVCPDCEPEFMKGITKYGEEHFIKGKCKVDQSFADFVREYRGSDAGVTITPIRANGCIVCKEPFSDKNTHSAAGWAETRISRCCEDCFDKMFQEDEEEE